MNAEKQFMAACGFRLRFSTFPGTVDDESEGIITPSTYKPHISEVCFPNF